MIIGVLLKGGIRITRVLSAVPVAVINTQCWYYADTERPVFYDEV